MVGLPYGGLDVAFGVQHLQMLGVRYYVAFSPSVINQANRDPRTHADRQDEEVAVTGRPVVHLQDRLEPDGPAAHEPAEHRGQYDEPRRLAQRQHDVVAQSETVGDRRRHDRTVELAHGHEHHARWTRTTTLPKVTVSDVKVGLQSISFHVSRIGVPVLVKISYFPRWHATGATGPYRVSPNLMVVIPTSRDVSMAYGSTPLLTVSNVISDLVALAGVVTLYFYIRRRLRARHQPTEGVVGV